jgi:hypothetical protein
MDDLIKKICGDSKEVFNPEEIGNNPDFVFNSDPSFATKILYDVEGNIINVNSWLECANYVNGGWSDELIDLFNGEKYLFILTVFGIITYAAINYLKKRRNVNDSI